MIVDRWCWPPSSAIHVWPASWGEAVCSAASAASTTRRARMIPQCCSHGTGGAPIGFFPAAISAARRSKFRLVKSRFHVPGGRVLPRAGAAGPGYDRPHRFTRSRFRQPCPCRCIALIFVDALAFQIVRPPRRPRDGFAVHDCSGPSAGQEPDHRHHVHAVQRGCSRWRRSVRLRQPCE